MTKLKMLLAWLRGATVMVPPDGVGYASYRVRLGGVSVENDSVNRWADRLREDGWTDWKPGGTK
jgi:hypothetical protein